MSTAAISTAASTRPLRTFGVGASVFGSRASGLNASNRPWSDWPASWPQDGAGCWRRRERRREAAARHRFGRRPAEARRAGARATEVRRTEGRRSVRRCRPGGRRPGAAELVAGGSAPACGRTPFTGLLLPGASTKDGTPGGNAGGADGASLNAFGAGCRSSKRGSAGDSPPQPGPACRCASFCQSGADCCRCASFCQSGMRSGCPGCVGSATPGRPGGRRPGRPGTPPAPARPPAPVGPGGRTPGVAGGVPVGRMAWSVGGITRLASGTEALAVARAAAPAADSASDTGTTAGPLRTPERYAGRAPPRRSPESVLGAAHRTARRRPGSPARRRRALGDRSELGRRRVVGRRGGGQAGTRHALLLRRQRHRVRRRDARRGRRLVGRCLVAPVRLPAAAGLGGASASARPHTSPGAHGSTSGTPPELPWAALSGLAAQLGAPPLVGTLALARAGRLLGSAGGPRCLLRPLGRLLRLGEHPVGLLRAALGAAPGGRLRGLVLPRVAAVVPPAGCACCCCGPPAGVGRVVLRGPGRRRGRDLGGATGGGRLGGLTPTGGGLLGCFGGLAPGRWRLLGRRPHRLVVRGRRRQRASRRCRWPGPAGRRRTSRRPAASRLARTRPPRQSAAGGLACAAPPQPAAGSSWAGQAAVAGGNLRGAPRGRLDLHPVRLLSGGVGARSARARSARRAASPAAALPRGRAALGAGRAIVGGPRAGLLLRRLARATAGGPGGLRRVVGLRQQRRPPGGGRWLLAAGSPMPAPAGWAASGAGVPSPGRGRRRSGRCPAAPGGRRTAPVRRRPATPRPALGRGGAGPRTSWVRLLHHMSARRCRSVSSAWLPASPAYRCAGSPHRIRWPHGGVQGAPAVTHRGRLVSSSFCRLGLCRVGGRRPKPTVPGAAAGRNPGVGRRAKRRWPARWAGRAIDLEEVRNVVGRQLM